MKFGTIVVAGSLGLLSAAAAAADLPARRIEPLAVAPPSFTWTGFYIGGNVGADVSGGSASRISGNDAARQTAILAGLRPGFGQIRNTGFAGGAQIGYNYQLGGLGGLGGFGGRAGGVVLGVEADAAYTNIGGTATYFSNRESDFIQRTDFVGTVRGRLGYAVGNVLLYGTGGFAYGGARSQSNFLSVLGNLAYAGGNNSIRTGYSYGGGVEFALPTQSFLNVFHSGAVTLRAEYLRYELGPTSYVIGNLAGLDPGYTQTIRNNGNLVRAALNYKFDLLSAAAPVVARY